MNEHSSNENDIKIGDYIPMTEEVENFIAKYQETKNNISNEEFNVQFKNTVKGFRESCGGNFGEKAYLINTDRKHSYTVTVRKSTQRGLDGSQKDFVYEMAAGARRYLGCAINSATEKIKFKVVGEEKTS